MKAHCEREDRHSRSPVYDETRSVGAREAMGKKKGMTRVFNIYNNNLKADQSWDTVRSNTRRRALTDAE